MMTAERKARPGEPALHKSSKAQALGQGQEQKQTAPWAEQSSLKLTSQSGIVLGLLNGGD